jgi:hypothetical protein
MPKPDMSLTVNVNVTGQLNGNTVTVSDKTYTQTASSPVSAGVVDSSGDIDLTKMSDPGNNYSNQTDITFMLSGTITDNQGNSYEVVFPDQVSNAVTITGGSGANQFTPSLLSETSLLLDDADSNGQTYQYCLTIEPDIIVADGSPPTCPLDPQIVNR